MVNVMKFIKQKKEQLKEYSKKRDFEKQRDMELKAIKLEKEAKYHSKLLERQKRIDQAKNTIKKSKENTFVGKLAKKIGENVNKAHKSNKKTKSKVKKIPFGQHKTRWG